MIVTYIKGEDAMSARNTDDRDTNHLPKVCLGQIVSAKAHDAQLV